MKAKIIATIALAVHILAYHTSLLGLVYLNTWTGAESTYFDRLSALAFVGYFWAWNIEAKDTYWKLFSKFGLVLMASNCIDEWVLDPCTYSIWEPFSAICALVFICFDYYLISTTQTFAEFVKRWRGKL